MDLRQSRSWALPDTTHVILALTMGVMLVSLSAAVLTLPWLFQLVALLALIVALAFFSQPAISLFAFFALRAIFDLLWWIPADVFGLNAMELFSGAVAGLATILLVLELRRLPGHPGFLLFLPYLLVMTVAATRNLDIRDGLEIVARYLSPFVLMFLVTWFFDTRRMRKLLFDTITLAGVVCVAVSMWHLANGQMATYELDGFHRLLGGYKNLHNHALMMMFFSALATHAIFTRRNTAARLFFGVYLACSLTALYLTYVRTAWLAFGGFLLTYLWVTGRRGWLVVITILGGIVLSTSATFQSRFRDLVLFFTLDADQATRSHLGSGRVGLWNLAIHRYLQHPLGDIVLGVGLGKHWLLTRPERFLSGKLGLDPHCDYLTLTFQMGPIALLSYVGQQVVAVRHALALRARGPDPWARGLGHLVIALTTSVVIANTVSNAFVVRTTLGWYFWGLAGLLYAEWLRLPATTGAVTVPSQRIAVVRP